MHQAAPAVHLHLCANRRGWLASRRPASRCRGGRAASKPVAVKYTSFNGEAVDRFAWLGKHVAFQTVSKDLDAAVMAKLLQHIRQGLRILSRCHPARADQAQDVRGPSDHLGDSRTPAGPAAATWVRRASRSCRAASKTSIKALRKHDEIDQALPYEFGRNFWLYSQQLAPRRGAYADAIITGYAVFMRFMAVEAAGRRSVPFAAKAARGSAPRLNGSWICTSPINR